MPRLISAGREGRNIRLLFFHFWLTSECWRRVVFFLSIFFFLFLCFFLICCELCGLLRDDFVVGSASPMCPFRSRSEAMAVVRQERKEKCKRG